MRIWYFVLLPREIVDKCLGISVCIYLYIYLKKDVVFNLVYVWLFFVYMCLCFILYGIFDYIYYGVFFKAEGKKGNEII